ncbi:MAG TPA: hypothetical protein VL983_04200 [Terriglobales bacterium]|nr:hypothetical protein [Terriglobales bacterium]
MTENSFENSLRIWRDKLRQLAEERNRIEAELAKAEAVAKALAQSIDDPKSRQQVLTEIDGLVRPEGFTDAIRRILRTSKPPALTPPEIRDRMIESGFNLGPYQNPLASIHAILTRLRNKHEVRRKIRNDVTVYEWIGD